MTLPVAIEASLFPDSEWSDLTALSSELADAYAKRQIFRTETEARVSVLDTLKFPTRAARYWQSVREQTTMLEQLAMLSFEYRRNEVAIKRHGAALKTDENPFDQEEAQINLDECLFKRAGMRSVATDRAREIKLWSKLKAEADDGSFDTTSVDTHQLVSYTARFAMTAATAQPGQMSADEFANLSGQLQTALARCAKLGVLDELRAVLPTNVAKQIGGLA